ncbi:GNAT family N-acetyltransferase [Carboxylicivirga taeanensis]|uniref:GNAT family N-acetyltransferase n=1 Tax=Carboxylicivirga taeanensis TaxID=1416875 RepID=UPI003F6E1463
MLSYNIEDNGEKGRFILFENDLIAGEMRFRWEGQSKIVIDETKVGDEFGGKGYGKRLVNEAVDYARSKKIKIVPECAFVKAVLSKDESLKDVRE